MILTHQTLRLRIAILGSAIILASCLADPDTCNSVDYFSLVDANIAAVTLPSNIDSRIINEGDLVTMDFVPERLNIEVDAQGTIQRLSCG